MSELSISIPVKGSLLVRFDGSDDLHEVGRFEQEIPVKFDGGAGHTTVRFSRPAR